MRPKLRHRGAARSSTLRGREVGGLFPEGASDFPHWGKCSEYTGPTRWLLPRPAPVSIARCWP
jgi:hypothetical protein